MIKLTKQSEKNSPKAYDEIFKARETKGADEFDIRRWNILLKYFEGGTIYDLGCLDSLIPTLISKQDNYVGVDLAEECIWKMRAKYPHFLFRIGDIYNLKEYQQGASYVILGEVLEHLESPNLAIKQAANLLKKGGILAVSVPLEEAREPGAIDGERHLWSFSEQDIRELLEPFGEVKIEILRSIKEPVYKYCWPTLVAWCIKK